MGMKLSRSCFLLAGVFCLFLPGCSCWAGARLVCDAQNGVTHYEICVNEACQTVTALPDGALSFDLSSLVAGSYVFSVKALIIGNDRWGSSLPSVLNAECFKVGPVERLSVSVH